MHVWYSNCLKVGHVGEGEFSFEELLFQIHKFDFNYFKITNSSYPFKINKEYTISEFSHGKSIDISLIAENKLSISNVNLITMSPTLCS